MNYVLNLSVTIKLSCPYNSFKVVEESLKYLSIDYFLGRCSFMASKGELLN